MTSIFNLVWKLLGRERDPEHQWPNSVYNEPDYNRVRFEQERMRREQQAWL